MALANLTMEYALLTHDFSVSYVAHVGSRAVPTWVSIVSLWSSHGGSISFGALVMGAYVAVATWRKADEHPEYMPYAVGVWLACGAFFSFLLAGPAEPFATIPNPALDGPGPNPLLQNHYLMVIPPPFLYSGYVGMTIPFGLACAALLVGRLGNDFIRPLRNFLLVSWIFLTCAIVLGGWWAYEVLGWGGYWAWDPVENASFLPWLTATAALHSALLVERKGVLKGWTATLVIATYLLTILGTFMTRSGVFNSVHSFTQSSIGPTILVFLAAALLFSVVLLALRIDSLESDGRIESAASREGMFLVNNLLFLILTFTVLIGTVFPLVAEAINGKQMSVGRPYFDAMVVPIGTALLFLIGVGPALPWGRGTREEILRATLPPLATGVVVAAIGYAVGVRNGWTIVTLLFGGYAAHVTLKEMWLPVALSGTRALRRGRRRFGSYVVHAGAVVVLIAIAVSSTTRTSREVRFSRGDSASIAGYTVTFLGAEDRAEPHRQSTIARFAVTKNGRAVTTLAPRMNQYATMREPIGRPDVHSTLSRDLYLSILNVDVAQQSVALHLIVTPMVMWIWIAALVMGLGGLMALVPSAAREPLRRESTVVVAA